MKLTWFIPRQRQCEYVFDKFSEIYFHKKDQLIKTEIKEIITEKNHRPFHANTDAHVKFKYAQLKKIEELQSLYTYINFNDEINYFFSR